VEDKERQKHARTSKCISERSVKETQERWRIERLRRRGEQMYKRQLLILFVCVEEKKFWLPSW